MKEIMKVRRYCFASLPVVLLMLAQCASAQPVISFDENGNATYNGLSVPVDTIVSGGLLILPTVLLPTSTLFTPGDILITEPGSSSPSDLLRFANFDKNGGGQSGVIEVYSDLEPGEINPDLADVPVLPSTTTQFIFQETGPDGTAATYTDSNNGLYNYVAAPGTPGSDLAGTPIIYNFTSDLTVPEPCTLGVLAVGSLVLMIRRRRAA
jgi:hypothetical protein